MESNNFFSEDKFLMLINANNLEEVLKFLTKMVQKEELELALEYYSILLQKYEELGDKLPLGKIFHFGGNLYRWKGDSDLSLDFYQKSLALHEELGNKQGMYWSLFYIGFTYEDRGELDRALEYYQKCLVLQEELGDELEIVNSLNIIGLYFLKKSGNLVRALEYHQKSLALHKELNDKKYIAISFNYIGNIHSHKGELDRALAYYQKSLTLEEERGNRFGIAYSLNKIGYIHYYKGELDRALELLQKALSLREEGGSLGLSSILFNIIQVVLAKNDWTLTNQYFSQLEKLQNQSTDKQNHFRYRLAHALILKQRKRLRQKMKAEEILVDLVEEDIIDYEKTVLAMKHLCELLLIELKTYGEEEVFEEVKNLVGKIYTIGQSQHSFFLLVEALVLQAKLSLLDGKINKALNFLDEAFQIAKENKLDKLVNEITLEQKTITAELDRWKELVDGNVGIYQRIEQARLEEYIRQVQKLARADID